MKCFGRPLAAMGIIFALSGGASAQSNDGIMRRLEALEANNVKLAQENAALRERVRRIESKEQPAAKNAGTKNAGTDAARPVFASASAVIYKAPPQPSTPPPWNGFYLGAHGGYGSFIATGPGEAFDQKGAFGGFQMGVNYQFWRDWLIGLESDFSLSDVRGTMQPLNDIGKLSTSYVFFGTARPRFGFIWGPLLVYQTAGVALADIKVNPMTDNSQVQAHRIMTGLAAGGGVEWAVAQDVTVKVEYLYLDFPAKNIPNNPPGTNATAVDVVAHTVKAGVNWLFH